MKTPQDASVLIQELAFGELLTTKVDEGVFFAESYCRDSYEIRAVGLLNGRLIAGNKSGSVVLRGKLTFDHDGLPYYDSEIWGKEVKEYLEVFLRNYQIMMAWGRMHEHLIESIRTQVLRENKQVKRLYKEFKANILPNQVAEAKDRLKLAEYSGIEPSYADEHLVQAAERIHEHAARKNESDLFRIWYVNYMKSKGYERKIRETYKLLSRDFKDFLAFETDTLKRNGFRLIRKSAMPKQLQKLQMKARNRPKTHPSESLHLRGLLARLLLQQAAHIAI